MIFGLFISHSYSANQYNYDQSTKKFTIIADENYTVDDIKKVFQTTMDFTSLSIQGTCNNIPLHAFDGASELTTVEITAPITHIYGFAFAHCQKLTTFTAPESLEYIGYNCFSQDIALETFYWRNHLMAINSNTFENCSSLTTFKQVDGDTTQSVQGVEKKFGDFVFMYCEKLTECQLPSDIKTLGKQVFAETPFLKSLEFPVNYKKVDEYAFQGCALENVNLADVEVVSFFAFSGSQLKSVTFSDKLQQICVSAFDGCRFLTTVNGLDTNENFVIQNAAFEGCISLKSMKIPTGMTEIPDYIFAVCSAMTSINLHNNIKKIGKRSFFNTGITSIRVGPLVEEIGEAAFGSMKELKEISVDPSNKNFAYDDTGKFLCNKDKQVIYLYPQENAAIKLTIQNTFTTILPYAFAYSKNLAEISLPDELVLIGGNAFEGCSKLQAIVFPKKATTIFMNVFANCKALISIDISNVETINDDAFRGCAALKDIKFGTSLQSISKEVFQGCSAIQVLDFSNCQNLTYIGE